MSDSLSGSDSEVPRFEFQRTLIILLDDDDYDDEVEETAHPPPPHRPKRPLPKNFRRNYRPPVKEETAQGIQTPFPEVYHTISCAPAVRDKSLEVRVLLSTAMSHVELCS